MRARSQRVWIGVWARVPSAAQTPSLRAGRKRSEPAAQRSRSGLDSYPVPNSKVVGRIVDNEAVLVLPEQGQVKVLNEVGARVWKLTDGSITAREIAGKISAEYQVEQANGLPVFSSLDRSRSVHS